MCLFDERVMSDYCSREELYALMDKKRVLCTDDRGKNIQHSRKKSSDSLPHKKKHSHTLLKHILFYCLFEEKRSNFIAP